MLVGVEGMQVRVGGCRRLQGLAAPAKAGPHDVSVPEWTPGRCLVVVAPTLEHVTSTEGQHVASLVGACSLCAHQPMSEPQ